MEHRGNPVSQGFAVGKAYLYDHAELIIEEKKIDAGAAAKAIEKFETAKASAQAEIEAIRDQLLKNNNDKAKIFSAQICLLCDVVIDEEIREHIIEDMWDADWSIYKTYEKYIELMKRSKDPRFKERAADLQDVMRRMLMCSRGMARKSLTDLPEPCIVICNDLLPSDSANLDRSKVMAIVTQVGGETSHTAIISKSYEIPAVLGVPGILEALRDGQMIIVDAVDGKIFSAPDEQQISDYRAKISKYQEEVRELKAYQDKDPVTADGQRIDVMLNLGSVGAASLENEKYVDGVGLLRTEFLYMESDHLPTEEEQYEAYQKTLIAFGERPVTLRTLDIGGDKTLPYLELAKEANPFLGERAIRLCFRYPEIFRTQLRAALRASVHGNLWIMLPMIGSIEDIRSAKKMINEVRSELRVQGIPYCEEVKVGIMIEVPSVAVIADMVVREVDFASIGSNDLIQYTLAADRMNPHVTQYYQAYHPAVFRMIKNIAEEFNKAGKPICICGEMGGNPSAVVALIGFGIKKLSMNISSVAAVKKTLSRITMAKAREIAALICHMSTAEEIEAYLKKELR